MAIRIPYGVDPDEEWELDYCAESARSKISLQEAVAKSLTESAKEQSEEAVAKETRALADRASKAADALRADLAGYSAGSGPVFRVRAIPGRKRAELMGRHQEATAMADGQAKTVAMVEWARSVLKEAVVGHRNLRRPGGQEIPFSLEDGRVSERSLEAYTPIVADLAFVVFTQQRLGDEGKND